MTDGKKREFVSMEEERQNGIAQKGGQASHSGSNQRADYSAEELGSEDE